MKKKSGLSLIELSIYLVVISLLISVVTVGKVLMDRANVNSIISKITTYKNAFLLFQDTYGFVPGSTTVANCLSYKEFESVGLCSINSNTAGSLANNYTNSNILEENIGPFVTMRFLQASSLLSGVVANMSYPIVRGTGGYGFSYNAVINLMAPVGNGFITFSSVGGRDIRGPLVEIMTQTPGTSFNNFVGKNALIYFYNPPNVNCNLAITGLPSESSGTNCAQNTVPGVVPAAVASTIDITLDDGLPHTGRVLGLKSTANSVSGTSTDAVCNNNTLTFGSPNTYTVNADPQYLKSNRFGKAYNIKNGCNFAVLVDSE